MDTVKAQCLYATFFCILLKVNEVLICDRRMIKSQKTTGTITPVLYGRGSFQFSPVCKITRTSLEESEGGQGTDSVLICYLLLYPLKCQ